MKYNNKLGSILVTLLTFCTINNFYAQSSIEYFKLGDDKDKEENYKGAIEEYKKALHLDPHNIEILEKIVFAKLNNLEYRSALGDLNTLISLKPESSKFYYLRGFFQFNLKNYNAAILDYSKAIEIQEDKISNYNIYSERGLCKMRIKDYKGAIEDFNRILSIYPNADIAKHKREAELKLKQYIPSQK